MGLFAERRLPCPGKKSVETIRVAHMSVLQDDDIGCIGRERSLEEIQEMTFFSLQNAEDINSKL